MKILNGKSRNKLNVITDQCQSLSTPIRLAFILHLYPINMFFFSFPFSFSIFMSAANLIVNTEAEEIDLNVRAR